MLLFFLVLKWTTCKLTLSHFGSQLQWSKRKQIVTVELRYVKTDAGYGGTHTLTMEHGQLNWQSLLNCLVQYAVFSSPKPWKCHNIEGCISLLFRVCLAAPINLPTASPSYSKCACSSESFGNVAKRISHL